MRSSTPASRDLVARALDRLLEVSVVLGTDMDSGLAALGLTPPRAHLLVVLDAEGPSSQRALAEALDVTPRAVTTYVDDLVAAGLVTREPHPTDRRVVLVTPTADGRRLSEQLASGRLDLAAQLFDDVAPPDLEVLVDVLDHTLARLGELIAQAAAAETPDGEQR